jgi:hypothetical protein
MGYRLQNTSGQQHLFLFFLGSIGRNKIFSSWRFKVYRPHSNWYLKSAFENILRNADHPAKDASHATSKQGFYNSNLKWRLINMTILILCIFQKWQARF